MASTKSPRNDLLTTSSKFVTEGGWSPVSSYDLLKVEGGGVVVGPDRGASSVIAQSFFSEGGKQYRILGEASSAGSGSANASIQVNWHSEDGAFISAFIEQIEVGPERKSFSRVIVAPDDATHGTLYVAPGYDSAEAVHYTQMAVAPMRPVNDFFDYRMANGTVGEYSAILAAIIFAAASLFLLRWGAVRFSAVGNNLEWVSKFVGDGLRAVRPILGRAGSAVRLFFLPSAVLLILVGLFELRHIYGHSYDSRYHQIMVDLDLVWTNFSLSFGGNPLSSFGIQHPVNAHLSPAFWFGQFFDFAHRIFAQAVFQALVMFSFFVFMGRAITSDLGERTAIALIAVAFCWAPSLSGGAVPFNAILGLSWQEGTLATIAAFILFAGIGRDTGKLSLLYGAGFFALVVWYLLMLPYNAPFFILATAFLCTGALIGSESRKELLHKVLVSGAIVSGLLFLGTHHYLLSLFEYTPQVYFQVLAPPSYASLIDLNSSMLARAFMFETTWRVEISVFFSFALLGIIFAVRSGNAMAKSIAFAAISLQILVHAVSALHHIVDVPRMAFFYVDLMGAWVLALLAAIGLWSGIRYFLGTANYLVGNNKRLLKSPKLISSKWRQMWEINSLEPGNNKQESNLGIFVLLVAGGFYVAGLYQEPAIQWPPNRQSEFAQSQHRYLSLEETDLFRGRSVSLLGTQASGISSWSGSFAPALYDLMLSTNNDLMIDARHGGVPVVNEYGHWISPTGLTLLAAAFFEEDGVIERSSQSPRIYRDNLARLFGTSLVVTDGLIADMELVLTNQANGRRFNLYKINDPNVGQFSPVDQTLASDAHEILDALLDPSFDGSQQFVTEAPVDRVLTGADDVEVRIVKGPELSISGRSSGESLLVLPFEFSHCLTAYGDGLIDLIPVNLGQVGLLVEGEFSIGISYSFGLFSGYKCRAADLARIEQLDLDRAATGRIFRDW